MESGYAIPYSDNSVGRSIRVSVTEFGKGLSCKTSRPELRYNESPTEWITHVIWPGYEVGYSLPSIGEIKNV
jgi:hypothetical protein